MYMLSRVLTNINTSTSIGFYNTDSPILAQGKDAFIYVLSVCCFQRAITNTMHEAVVLAC